jgi:hypothetical protein
MGLFKAADDGPPFVPQLLHRIAGFQDDSSRTARGAKQGEPLF